MSLSKRGYQQWIAWIMANGTGERGIFVTKAQEVMAGSKVFHL